MTDKQMEEKRKEFYKFAFHTAICDKFLNPDSEECQCGLDDIWQWIEKLVEEVENRCWKECEASKENEAIQAGAGY